MYQIMSRKQNEGENLEYFDAELSGMVARCNLKQRCNLLVADFAVHKKEEKKTGKVAFWPTNQAEPQLL